MKGSINKLYATPVSMVTNYKNVPETV